jgi:hypothetical protein
MRKAFPLFAFVVLVQSGCESAPLFRRSAAPPERGLVVNELTAPTVVASLNDNARRIQSLSSNDLDMTCSQGIETINLRASLVCQKPRNFRLHGKMMQSTVVDMGSNDQEFWWWISKANPPHLYHCSHEEFTRSQGRIQLPFQPDWIMEALGMSEFDPRKAYTLVPKGNNLELVDIVVAPDGRQVRKVTMLSRKGNQVQVIAHLLQDDKGKEICSARVLQMQRDPATDAMLPRKVEMNWPAEKVKLVVTLNEIGVNTALPQGNGRLFQRPALEGVRTVDLARGFEPTSQPIRRANATLSAR